MPWRDISKLICLYSDLAKDLQNTLQTLKSNLFKIQKIKNKKQGLHEIQLLFDLPDPNLDNEDLQ